jgi:uncharacterized protein (DUF2384 family)
MKGGKAMSSKKKSVNAANGKKRAAKVSNGRKKTAKPAYDLFPGEKADIREEAAEVIPFPYAELWLDSPHEMLGLKKPNDLIGTEYEPAVRQILRMIKHGIPT